MSAFSMVSDGELLRHYVERASQPAFTELVQRHFQVVRRAAQRRVGHAHLADDITQRVFTDLARKAPRLTDRENVAGWLYTSVRFAAGDAVRAEQRRRAREAVAQAMQETTATPATVWSHVEPWLDEALDGLPESDREALLLHFFEGRTFPEVGAVLAVNADAARMRVNRALEKLRELLKRRGITSTAAVLGEALLTQTASAAGSPQAVLVAQEAMRQGALPAGGTLVSLGKVATTLAALGGAAALLFHFTKPAGPSATIPAPAPVAMVKVAESVPETKEAVHVTEETAIDEKSPQPVPAVAVNRDASLPTFSVLPDAEKRILKVLWTREQEFGATPGRAWSTSVAPDKPNYATFVAAREALRVREWVRVVGPQGGAALTEAGLAYCITQREALEAYPMPKTKPLRGSD